MEMNSRTRAPAALLPGENPELIEVESGWLQNWAGLSAEDRSGWPQNRSGLSAEDRNCSSVPEYEYRVIQTIAWSLN